MPGMLRAKRRQRAGTRALEQKLSQRFFGEDGIGMAYGTTTDGATPLLLFVLRCSATDVDGYLRRLADATLRLSSDGDFLVLDAIVDGASIGRLATTLSGDALPMVAAHLDAMGGDELEIALVTTDACIDDAPAPVTRPIEVVRNSAAQPEIVEVGSGPFVVLTTDVHTGVTFAHRFQTAEAAKAQNERNCEVDLPFVGLVAS